MIRTFIRCRLLQARQFRRLTILTYILHLHTQAPQVRTPNRTKQVATRLRQARCTLNRLRVTLLATRLATQVRAILERSYTQPLY
jgi:hypothetical protein